jgi:hypothetical protein
MHCKNEDLGLIGTIDDDDKNVAVEESGLLDSDEEV